MTPIEELYGLPEPIQEQLIRLARLSAGMSTAEKEAGRLLLGGIALGLLDVPEDALPAAEMVGVCAWIVQFADERSGAAASWLVT